MAGPAPTPVPGRWKNKGCRKESKEDAWNFSDDELSRSYGLILALLHARICDPPPQMHVTSLVLAWT